MERFQSIDSRYNRKLYPERVEFIVNALSTGNYTVREICEAAGITETTYYEWIHTEPMFAEAVKKAELSRMKAITEMATSALARKIQGYDYTERRAIKTRRRPRKGEADTGEMRVKEEHEVTKHVAPDTTAIIFALTNGDPSRWRNSHSVEARGTIDIKWSEERTYDKEEEL
jgi:hypothetical protein